MNDQDFDRPRFDDIRNRADQLKTLYGARDTMYEELKRMFLMEWEDKPTADWIRPTMSPRPHNALRGAVRLMTATDPQFSVSFDEADAQGKLVSDKLEQACRAMWAGAGRVAQKPVHYEVVFSALMFDEIDLDVERVADLVQYAELTQNKGLKNRIAAMAQHTPYLFTVHNPATCYGDFDAYGLRGRLRRAQRRWGEIKDSWGGHAERLGITRLDDDLVTINDWYDWQYRATWLEENDTPLFFAEHGLSFMPVLSMVVDGSRLFETPDEQRQPFFYPLYKSDVWRRENLSLTVAYSLLFALGSMPLNQMQVDDPTDPNQGVVIDRTVPGGIVLTRKGQPITPLMGEVVNPEHYRLMELSGQMSEESTISRMTLGTAPAGSMPFSAISLLSQSGRLPLVATRQMGGAAIATALTTALKWYKADPTGAKLYDKNNRSINLTANEIPDRIPLGVSLEPDVPTDKLQLANVALAMTQGQDPLASKRWVRENILQMGQSRNMQKEVWTEARASFELQRILQQLSAQDQAKIQAAMGQAQQQAQMQAQMGAMQQQMSGGMNGGGAGEQMSGGESAYLNGAVQPGAPLSGPLPSRTEG